MPERRPRPHREAVAEGTRAGEPHGAHHLAAADADFVLDPVAAGLVAVVGVGGHAVEDEAAFGGDQVVEHRERELKGSPISRPVSSE